MTLGTRTFLSSLVILFVTAIMHGAPSSYAWTGEGEDSYATTQGNWDEMPSGQGGENLIFGDIDSDAHHTIIIPALNFEFTVNDLYFTGTGPLDYTFNGTSTESMLYLQGDVNIETPGAVEFGNALKIILSYASDTYVDIAGNATLVARGVIEGDDGGGYISKTGIGTLELSGMNTFGHGFSLYEGTLRLGVSSNYIDYEVVNGPVGTGTLKLYNDTTLTVTSGGNFTLHNTVDLECGPGSTIVDIAADDRLHLAGDIFGEGGIRKTGAGELILSGIYSDFSGGVTVENGRLVIGATSSSVENYIWGPLGSGTLTLFGGATFGVQDPIGYDLYNEINLNSQGSGPATIDLQSGSRLYLYGDLSGSGDLTKTGQGLLVVNGYDNTYSGNVVVNAGTFFISDGSSLTPETVSVNSGGNIALGGSYLGGVTTINNGGKLTGSGYVSEAVIEAGGLLSPGSTLNWGDRIANLTFQELTLGQDSILEIDIQHYGDGEFNLDTIMVSAPSTLTITADAENPLTLRLVSLNSDGQTGDLTDGLQLYQTYNLTFLSYLTINGDLELGGNVLLDTDFFTGNFSSATFSLTNDDNAFTLSFTPVPEPSTYALLALGLGVVGLSVWRRRRS